MLWAAEAVAVNLQGEDIVKEQKDHEARTSFAAGPR
jgi:hypothetical protein